MSSRRGAAPSVFSHAGRAALGAREFDLAHDLDAFSFATAASTSGSKRGRFHSELRGGGGSGGAATAARDSAEDARKLTSVANPFDAEFDDERTQIVRQHRQQATTAQPLQAHSARRANNAPRPRVHAASPDRSPARARHALNRPAMPAAQAQRPQHEEEWAASAAVPAVASPRRLQHPPQPAAATQHFESHSTATAAAHVSPRRMQPRPHDDAHSAASSSHFVAAVDSDADFSREAPSIAVTTHFMPSSAVWPPPQAVAATPVSPPFASPPPAASRPAALVSPREAAQPHSLERAEPRRTGHSLVAAAPSFVVSPSPSQRTPRQNVSYRVAVESSPFRSPPHRRPPNPNTNRATRGASEASQATQIDNILAQRIGQRIKEDFFQPEGGPSTDFLPRGATGANSHHTLHNGAAGGSYRNGVATHSPGKSERNLQRPDHDRPRPSPAVQSTLASNSERPDDGSGRVTNKEPAEAHSGQSGERLESPSNQRQLGLTTSDAESTSPAASSPPTSSSPAPLNLLAALELPLSSYERVLRLISGLHLFPSLPALHLRPPLIDRMVFCSGGGERVVEKLVAGGARGMTEYPSGDLVLPPLLDGRGLERLEAALVKFDRAGRKFGSVAELITALGNDLSQRIGAGQESGADFWSALGMLPPRASVSSTVPAALPSPTSPPALARRLLRLHLSHCASLLHPAYAESGVLDFPLTERSLADSSIDGLLATAGGDAQAAISVLDRLLAKRRVLSHCDALRDAMEEEQRGARG